ncbi:MAG: hypothetical protein JJU36_06050 [Phycisphaeraceae bacterium]|nr:hypothetical protein [Phycisphaeraceae bacterium]
MQPRVIASCFALTAFAASIVVGAFWAGNPPLVVLWRALLIMAICYPVGLIVGGFCFRLIEDHINEHRRNHPLEDITPIPADESSVEIIDPSETSPDVPSPGDASEAPSRSAA